MSKSGFLQRQRNFWSEALWKPKSKLSLEQLKYLHYILSKNAVVSEHNRDLLVETLRSMAEILIWGDQNDAHVMDFFLEKNMLSFFLKIMKQKFGRFVCVQLLQTLNILFENMRNETSLYYLLSNNHINAIIVHKFDFSDEEVLAYYISFLKTLSLKLNKHTIHFFYNEHLSDFPLYAEAIQFFNHSESMVRIAVRTISLNVYQIGDGSVLEFICNRSAVPYFTNLVWFIGNHVLQLDECVSTTASHLQRGRLESMVAEQLDLVHYLNDILSLGVDSLNRLLVSHLLDRLIIPLYIYSLDDAGHVTAGSEEQPRIGRLLSLFLLAQKLLIIKHAPLVSSLAEFVLRGEIRTVEEAADGATPKVSRHCRYPSHSSLRAFIPPAEPIGAPIAAASRTSSINSVPHAVAPSPTTSAKGRQSIHNATPDGGRPGSAAAGEKSSRVSLSSFTDVGSGVLDKDVSNELIPMVSVHRMSSSAAGDDDAAAGGGGDNFSVHMLEQRTRTVGNSRFFESGTPPATPPQHRRQQRGGDELGLDMDNNGGGGGMPDASMVSDVLYRTAFTSMMMDETDGSAASALVAEPAARTAMPATAEWSEIALEADSDEVAVGMPVAEGSVTGESCPTAAVVDSGGAAVVDGGGAAVAAAVADGGDEVADGSDAVAAAVAGGGAAVADEGDVVADGAAAAVATSQASVHACAAIVSTSTSLLGSEVDSGIFSEQTHASDIATPDVGTPGTANATLSHPLQQQQQQQRQGSPQHDQQQQHHDQAATGDDGDVADDTDTRLLDEDFTNTLNCTMKSDSQPEPEDMSPYLRTVLSSLPIRNGHDRDSLFSVVVFFAMLRHKGIGNEVFENVQIGKGEVCEDVRSLMVDRVIELIGQICHDCSTSRLITLQAALVVLQALMKDDPRSVSALARSADVATVTASHGEPTPMDGACTSEDGVAPAVSREAVVAFEDTEPAVPNALPAAKDCDGGAPATSRGRSSSGPCISTGLGAGAAVAGELAVSAAGQSPEASSRPPGDASPQASSSSGGCGGGEAVEASDSGAGPPATALSSQSQGRDSVGPPPSPGFHKRVTDVHIARLHNAYEDGVRQLRLLYKGKGDDIFLDMFEDEYFNVTKGARLSIEYLMNDASTLLPPTQTPLTGIPFEKRLPNGEVERTRRAMQVFFLVRQLVVNLLGEKDVYLPLMPTGGQLKVDDRPNLMNTDLLACTVYMDDTEKPLKRFFFIGETQMILVEPDMTQLGWGVVRYVANLEDIDVATDAGDNSLLHVTFHQPLAKRRRFTGHQRQHQHQHVPAAARQTINTWQFEFNDHIRCTAAKKRILQACERVKLTKQGKICALLQIPGGAQLVDAQSRQMPSAVNLVGLDRSVSGGTGSTAQHSGVVAPAMATASVEVVMSPVVTVPPSVPAPLELAPLVIDTSLPASAAVMRTEAGFEVISVDDPNAEQDAEQQQQETPSL